MRAFRIFLGAAVFAAACFMSDSLSNGLGTSKLLVLFPIECVIALVSGMILYSGVKNE